MSIKSRISDKSPQIFLAAGIISFVGAVITAALKSEEVKPIFKTAKEEIKATSIDEDRYGFKNETEVKLYKAKVATVAAIDISKTMAVSIGLTVFGTCCICKSYKLMNNKQLALIGGIDILDAGYKSFRETVKENVDEKTMQKIDDEVRAKNVSKQINAIKKVDNHICNDVETFTRFFSEETSNKYPTGGADTVFPFSNLKRLISISCFIYVAWYILTRSSMLLDYLKTMRQNASFGSRMAARTLSILVFLGLILSIMIIFLIAITV